MSNTHLIKSFTQVDEWSSLQQFTNARIALGRTGTAIPLKECLKLKLAHAHARDAVFSTLDKHDLVSFFKRTGLDVHFLKTEANNRNEYLHRPDLGRRLHEFSTQELQTISNNACDVAIIIADGLSAEAINQHAIPLLQLLVSDLTTSGITIAPLIVVEQGRVAIADEIGFLLKAKISLILIGERPGLSSPHSMGAYLTYNPQPGLTDESRNCISNIHQQGLSYTEAAENIIQLIKRSLRLKLSGIQLKDNNLLIT